MGKWDKVQRGMENRGLLHVATAGVCAAVCATPCALAPFVFSGKAQRERQMDGKQRDSRQRTGKSENEAMKERKIKGRGGEKEDMKN